MNLNDVNFKFSVDDKVMIKSTGTYGTIKEQRIILTNSNEAGVVEKFSYLVIQKYSASGMSYNEDNLAFDYEVDSKNKIKIYDEMIDISLGNGTTTLDKEGVLYYIDLKNKAIEAYKNEKKVKTK